MTGGRRSRFSQLLAVITACAAALVVAAPADAAFPGRNGQIAFSSTRTGSLQIYRANADGSDVDQLTHTSSKHNSVFMDWSPNGREITFDSDRTGAVQVYTMRADGSDVEQLTHMTGFTAYPSWSPDGKRIVFAHTSTGDPPASLYTIRAEGGGLRRLTHANQNQTFPQYSPDGRWIVFTSHTPADVPAVYLMHADGSHLHRLTPLWLRASTADWSPDGRQIVSNTNTDRPHSVLFTIRPNGTGVHLITHGPTQRDDFSPSYSPEGDQIVFIRVLNQNANADLWVVNADGTHPRDITNTPLVTEFASDWGTFRESAQTTDRATRAAAATWRRPSLYRDQALLRK